MKDNEYKIYKSVAYGNSKWISIHDNKVATSIDGSTWNISQTNLSDYFYSIAFGNSIFVAIIGSPIQKYLATSNDGINWVIQTTPVNLNWTSIIYGNEIFVVVANDGTTGDIITSNDAITWTQQVTPSGNYYWKDITYGNIQILTNSY